MEKIDPPGESHRQRRGSCLAVACQPHVAQDGIELSKVLRMEVNGDCCRAGHGVRAQMAMSLQLAGRQMQNQLAQINRAVALGIGGVNQAAGKHLPLSSLCGRREAKQGAHGEGTIVAVEPQRIGRAVDARVEAEMLKGRIAEHFQQRVQGNVFELSCYLAVDGDGDLIRGWERMGDGAGLGRARWRSKPGSQREIAINLAALAQAKKNRCNQQLFGIGMNMRIETKAGGDDAGSDVSAVFDVNSPIGAEAACFSGPGEVQMGNAFRRIWIAGDGVNQAQVQLAHCFGLPAGMGKIIQGAGDFQSPVLVAAAAGGDAQGAQSYGVARQLQRALEIAMNRRRCFARPGRSAACEIQIADAGFDEIRLLASPCG